MIRRISYLLFTLPLSLLQAQPAVAPTPTQSISERGTDWGSYNVTDSFEFGYRFNEVGGDSGLYRSNVNFGNGFRLLGSNFTANSKEGRGFLFDSMVLTTQGLGNDPYSTATMHIEKNDVYRYDMTWRRSDYFNTSLLSGTSQNLDQFRRNMQDHDVRISAKRWLKLRLGYSRNTETGPIDAFYELYIGGLARSRLPIQKDTRDDFNEYRVGADIDFAGFRLSLTQQSAFYKDDTPVASLIPGQSYPLINTSLGTSYVRSEPMHTRTLSWLGNLSKSRKFWAMNARMTYSKSDQNNVYNEWATANAGTGTSNVLVSSVIANVSTTANGEVSEPYVNGDLSFSLFPTDRLSIVNTVSVYNNRFAGSESTLQLSSVAATKNIFYFSLLGTGRVNESTDVNYRFTKWLAASAGYMYTDRWVDDTLQRSGTTNSLAAGALTGHLHAATFGLRLRPLSPLTINLDATIGKDNAPYTPISAATYHTMRARADYRKRNLRLSATYRQLYNTSAPVTYAYNDSHSRDFTANSSYILHRGLSLDLTYSKAHLDTFGLIYAELPNTAGTIVNVRGYNSAYVSNIHTVSAGVNTAIGKRAKIYMGYNLTRDTGDGRSVQNLGLADAAAAYLASRQTSPMKYQAPMARLSIRLTPKLQWNAGWEFYRYNQEFAFFAYQPYYRAQTGYTSLSWAF